MAVPKRRKSKSKSRMRRSHNALVAPNLRPCTRCGAYVMPHRVCPECGHYKGTLVLEPKVKVEKAK
ncbi:MAG TPA: 50S ribosomal protein L32 [Spirochaetota bacterium]|nr:50S ribosomal protein L32 [Spirochaetota bacterium]HNT11601.1 50S ribosomal protein L32 [Spirochaetota bacterium]